MPSLLGWKLALLLLNEKAEKPEKDPEIIFTAWSHHWRARSAGCPGEKDKYYDGNQLVFSPNDDGPAWSQISCSGLLRNVTIFTWQFIVRMTSEREHPIFGKGNESQKIRLIWPHNEEKKTLRHSGQVRIIINKSACSRCNHQYVSHKISSIHSSQTSKYISCLKGH